MAAGMSFKQSFTLLNAPAGSGKTTAISNCIKNLIHTSEKKILCITFTNRATEQLKIKVDDEHADISTIHSFISNLMTPFFKKKGIVAYYGDIFGRKLDGILNSNQIQDLERIEKYKIRKCIGIESLINREVVIENISEIYYSETQFSSYLYGGLSHDDLLFFSREVLRNFPKINNLISQKYSHVFIDEYQDTNSEILELFYNATIGTNTKLVLLGDEMQQIYTDRVDGFEAVIENFFFRDDTLKKNWRSDEHIVTVLNNLYFDKAYTQEPTKIGGEKPKLHLVANVDEVKIQDDVLQLVLYNIELFDQIGAGNLYRAFTQKYQTFDKYNPKQILLDMTLENPDELMIILILITEIVHFSNQGKYGEVFKRITKFNYKNEQKWKVIKHLDKVKINEYIQDISVKFNEDITIIEMLNYLYESNFFDENHLEEILNNINENINFKDRINKVKLVEFKNCYTESNKQTISTQHAVKGEGHESVALKITDGFNPNVQMYLFLELWSRDFFDYLELKNIIGKVKAIKEKYNSLIGFKLSSSNINKETYQVQETKLKIFIDEIITTLMLHKNLFELIFQNDFKKYLKSPNATNFKSCLTVLNKIEGIILAYKLFYVGCSRAMNKLDVYVSHDKVKNFENDFLTKMESTGFIVVS